MTPRASAPGAYRDSRRPVAQPAPGQVRELVRRQWAGWLHRQDLDTLTLHAAHYDQLLRPGFFYANGRLNAAAGTSTLSDVFERVQVPVLILAGRHSRVVGPKPAQRLASRFLDARAVLFEHSGHAMHVEEPGRFVEVVGPLGICRAPPPPRATRAEGGPSPSRRWGRIRCLGTNSIPTKEPTTAMGA